MGGQFARHVTDSRWPGTFSTTRLNQWYLDMDHAIFQMSMGCLVRVTTTLATGHLKALIYIVAEHIPEAERQKSD
jgi:hypothetical protein